MLRQPFLHRVLMSVAAKPVWFLLSSVPAVYLLLAALGDNLGANPAEAIIRATGDWALRALCLVLSITPLRTSLGLSPLARFRRMAGLFVYFYAVLHLLAYAWLDQGFDVAAVASDIGKRPFILVGFSAWLVLTPLALTSWNRLIRALGGRLWRRLHALVHLVSVMAVLHFFWIRAGKHNFTEVAIYAFILASLMAWRLTARWRHTSAADGRFAGGAG